MIQRDLVSAADKQHNNCDSNCKDILKNTGSPYTSFKATVMEEGYQVVEIPGKGRGLVATRNLEAGELVLSEKMFLKLDSNSAKDLSVFLKLDPKIKEKLGKLSCPAEDMGYDKSDPEKYLAHCLLKKFRLNRICTAEKSSSCAVFEIISMINHSCVPNVYWFWMEDKTTMEIRVLKKIAEGEEIVTTYIHLHSGAEFPLRHHRMKMLLPWKFVCRSFSILKYILQFQTFSYIFQLGLSLSGASSVL